ncbi:MAG: hypothetical protein AAF512_17865 [Pseudomonadota bacterium]
MILRLIAGGVAALCLSFSTFSAYAEAPGTSNKARVNYILFCAGCHRLDGSGSPESQVPDLREHLAGFARFEAGREYLVQVPGSATVPLNDVDLADVINWILKNINKVDFDETTPALTG